MAFRPSLPHHLVSTFQFPASTRWIEQSQSDPPALKESYFIPFQDSLYLPMELTMSSPAHGFMRTTAPLAVFIEYLRHLQASGSRAESSAPRMYIAQAPLHLLPDALRDDISTPELMLKAGKGDIYGSSLWMGPSFAARTPLHRDPNANILVQVAGEKIVRLLPPRVGMQVYQTISSDGDAAQGTMRGEEMMGAEGRMLDEVVWDEPSVLEGACEAVLQPGDGVFIPQGWWHSIRGAGKSINMSVNWWFR